VGIEALHKANIAYRDLKTENILLDNLGHIKICDFGLSKQNMSSMSSGASTRCGTTELMAPEIYGTSGYGKAVDWWSLGILIYQMIHGKFPFEDNDPTRLVQKVLTCEAKFKDSVSKECKDTVKGLLNKNVKQRLGTSNTNDIKKSPFFAKIDFVQVQMKRYTPEFRPPVDKSLSTFPGFDDMFIKETPGDSFMPAESRDSNVDNYSGFTYIQRSDK
jgi:serum/glucocorticoid-regulated kinase 2